MFTQFQTSQEAFAFAEHKARYAHKSMLVWREGERWFSAAMTVDSLKAALLACGTKGKFWGQDGKIGSIYRWRQGLTMWRNAKNGWL